MLNINIEGTLKTKGFYLHMMIWKNSHSYYEFMKHYGLKKRFKCGRIQNASCAFA
uniref:Uncharacterized protein n=1 Tax=Anopheles quadriannulatus TaxID=34691 RepID=A0A182XS27_ANOQN